MHLSASSITYKGLRPIQVSLQEVGGPQGPPEVSLQGVGGPPGAPYCAVPLKDTTPLAVSLFLRTAEQLNKNVSHHPPCKQQKGPQRALRGVPKGPLDGPLMAL